MAAREKEVEKRVRDEESERRVGFERRLADEITSLRNDFSTRQNQLLQQVESAISRIRLSASPQPISFPSAWDQQRAPRAVLRGRHQPPLIGYTPAGMGSQPPSPPKAGSQASYSLALASSGAPAGTSENARLASELLSMGGTESYLDGALSALGDSREDEASQLREHAQQQVEADNAAILQRLSQLEKQVNNEPSGVDVAAAGATDVASTDSSARRKLEERGAPEMEDQQYLDALLEDFLNKGADLSAV
jgi:hypothetical protein